MLAGEGFLVNFIAKTEVQQAVLLVDQEGGLSLKLRSLGLGIGLGIAGLRGQYCSKPLPHRIVLDPHLIKDGQHLAVKLRLRHPVTRMARLGVSAAAVVDIAFLSRFGLLFDLLTGDRPPAMPTTDEFTGIGHLVRVVHMPTEERLDTIPDLAFDQDFLIARIPLPLEWDFADIGAIRKNVVEFAARKLWGLWTVDDMLFVESITQRIEGERLICVEMKDFLHGRRSGFLSGGDTPSILADIEEAVGSLADKPALLHAASKPLFDIERLLLCIKAGHIRQRAPHHTTSGVVVGGLGHGYEGEVVLTL